MNHLIGQKIAITSNKPQTTRNRIQTVYTDMERGQIVFWTRRESIRQKNKLGEYMVNTAEHTLNEVDVIPLVSRAVELYRSGGTAYHRAVKKTKNTCDSCHQ